MKELEFFTQDSSFAADIEEMKNQCRSLLPKNFIRGDYKELVKLVLFYLGDSSQERVQFLQPGALHKARWMAKILYSIKMVMLAPKIMSQLPRGAVFGARQLGRLQSFVKFVVTCYVPWWLTAPVAAYAPTNDVALVARLRRYAEVDETCSDAAIKSFERHIWYLTQELVPLTLFCGSVSDSVKEAMVEKLKEFQRKPDFDHRFGSSFGKPSFPDLDLIKDLKMEAFIGQDSWMFFKVMKVDTAFLERPVSSWCSDPGYLRAKEVIGTLSVVNDSAERGVKLANDFLGTTPYEERYSNILQVVEESRKNIPNLRKIRKYHKNRLES